MNADNQVRVDITADESGLKAGTAEARRDLDALKNSGEDTAAGMSAATLVASGLAIGIAAVGVAALGAAAFIGKQIISTAAAQDEMLKMSQAAGMTTESLSGLGYAAEQSGSSVNALVAASKTLSKEIVEASRTAEQGTTVFGAMGVRIRDASGALRSTDQILLDVADKFLRMSDGANKSALAVKLFGRSGVELIPFLNEGRDGLSKLTAEAERLGIVVSTDAARMSEQFNDNLTKIGKAAEGVGRQIGNSALPMLSALVDQFAGAAAGSNSLAGDLRNMFSRANVEAWAENGAYAVAILGDGFRYAAAGAQSVGIAVAGVGLAIAQARDGYFAEAKDTLAAIPALIGDAFSFEQLAPKVTAFFSELRAKTSQEQQKTNDALKKGAADYVEFDEATLKKQAALREKYGAEEKLRAMGEYQYKKELIEKKYAEDLAAVNGARDQASLEVAIRQKMHDEITALERSISAAAVSGNAAVLASASASAAARVAIEGQAAGQVAAAWNQANAVKAAASASTWSSDQENLKAGGVPLTNADGSFAFVSSWNADGEYIGNKGKSVGFATGGSFLVGGSGGTDTTPVNFMATPGERVTIETPEQQRAASGAVTVNVNVSGGNPQSIIAAIQQALRVNPALFSPSFARPG